MQRAMHGTGGPQQWLYYIPRDKLDSVHTLLPTADMSICIYACTYVRLTKSRISAVQNGRKASQIYHFALRQLAPLIQCNHEPDSSQHEMNPCYRS